MSKKAISLNKEPENIIVALQQAQARSGYLTDEFMMELAGSLGVAVSDVYGVASFYSFLATRPLGRNVIRVCKSLPCYLKNGQAIIDTLIKEIGIKPGETTADGRFSLELTNCIGLCDKAPAMLINGDPHVCLTPQKIAQILRSYK